MDKEYIEKMIQLPVHIPELSSKDIQNYLLLLVMQKYMKPDSYKAGMKNECDEVAKVILQIRFIVAHTLKGNPWQAKRFLNTSNFALA